MVNSRTVFDTKHKKNIHEAELDYYGKILATASSDNSIRLWDVSGDGPIFLTELLGHEGPVWKLSWSHPIFGHLLASCSYDTKILLWKQNSANQWSLIYRNKEHTSSVNSVSFSPSEYGLHLAAGSSDGSISIVSYHVEASQWTRKAWNAHPNGVLSIDWSPVASQHSFNTNSTLIKQRRLVSGGCDNQIRVWLYIDNTEEWILSQNLNTDKLCNDWIRHVAWRPYIGSYNCIATCSADGYVIFWAEGDSQSWKPKQILQFNAPAWKVSWFITGTILAITYGEDQIEFYRETSVGTWEKIQDPTSAQQASALPSSYSASPEAIRTHHDHAIRT